MFRTLILSLALSSILLALTPLEEAENTRRNDTTTNTAPVVKKTYVEATDSAESKNWNTQDWKKHLEKNGRLDTGLIGSSQANMRDIKGSDLSYDANPNNINTTKVRANTDLSDVKSLHSFSESLQTTVLDTNVSRTTSNINLEQTTKCYITREMPTRYKCDKTGLVYGGGINTSGVEAKKICETECYEQFSCVNVSPTATTAEIALGTLTASGKTQSKVERDTTAKIDSIEFSATVDKAKVYFDIVLVTKDGTERYFNRKMLLGTKAYSLKINQDAATIKIITYGSEDDSSGRLDGIVVKYKQENKFICPASQDISDKTPGEFAFVCPSGKINTFSANGMTYKICQDSGVVGTNSDGTFSNQDSCSNICKNTYSCALDTISVATNSLQNFREGCIEGQTGCSIDTCRELRINKNQVLNENVFYGDFSSHPTVVSGAAVQGITRPKILLKEDVDFATRSKEEWKDEAYANMIKNGTFRTSAMKLNENTNESNAFNTGMVTNSVDATTRGNAIRSLYWVNKPKAFDVNNGQLYKHYAILEINADTLRYDSYGKKIRVKDKILYVKTTADDTFKAFAIKRNFAKKDYFGVDDSVDVAASWSYEYFNSSLKSWFGHSSGTALEYYKNSAITVTDTPYLRIPIVANNNNLMYNLSGIIRSVTSNGPLETLNYTGDFNGTGQVISQVKIYAFYSNESLTYADAVEKIDAADWTAIYNNTSISSMPQNVVSDTYNTSDSLTMNNVNMKKSNDDIEIFLYGNEAKKTAFTRIKPKEEDIGKKAFVYIFAQ